VRDDHDDHDEHHDDHVRAVADDAVHEFGCVLGHPALSRRGRVLRRDLPP
jgi:hypothetical protein